MAKEIELKDFVSNALVEIAVGVSKANEALHKEHSGRYSNSPYRLHCNMGDYKSYPGVSFDLAVTTTEGEMGSAGAKISVASVLGVGGKIEENQSESYAHRIKFTVGLSNDWD